MTEQLFPITPPDELVQRLRNEAPHGIRDAGVTRELCLIADAYRAGADQELEACCLELVSGIGRLYLEFPSRLVEGIRFKRRPKPQSLKEQALTALSEAGQGLNKSEWQQRSDTIRRALEQLND